MEKSKVILGIDPGTNILGYGIIRVGTHGPKFVDMGVFDLRKIKDPFEKLANIFTGVGELIDEHKPDELAVESPFYGKNAQVPEARKSPRCCDYSSCNEGHTCS